MKAQLARFAYALFFLLVAGYALITLTGARGISALREKQRKIEALEKRNADLNKHIEQQQERIRRLGADPAEQERIIEERLKLVHPDDQVYMLPDSGKK